MGGKQWKNRKHLLFYGACFLIVFLISEGCIFSGRSDQALPVGDKLVEKASMMVSKGHYNDALKAYSKIARSYPNKSPGDRALFEMGLIWAYPDNPWKNHEEALKYFNKLLRDFPRSPLKREASAWVDILSEQSRHNGQIKELENKIVFGIEQRKKESRAHQERINACKEEIRLYKEDIRSYKDQISALKEIDIGVEEKKRTQ